MKIIFLIIAMFAVVNADELKQIRDKAYPLEVRQFIASQLRDEEEGYRKSEEWIDKQKDLKPEHRDQMLAIVSALVWNTDPVRARIIVKKISNKKLRDQIYSQYKELEKIRRKFCKEGIEA